MKKSNFALRLQPSLLDEARRIAKAQGIAVNQLINIAVAEMLSARRAEEALADRERSEDRSDRDRSDDRSDEGPEGSTERPAAG